MSVTDLAAPVPSREPARFWLPALAAIVLVLLAPSAAHADGSEWTAQQTVGPPYTGTTFSERYRYVNPQILAFSDGTAEVIWSDIAGPAPGIRGRHLGTDGIPTGTPYDLSTPTGTEGLPNVKVAPLTGNLGVVVLDTPGRNTTDRVIRGRFIGPNGPTGTNFDIRAIPNSTPVGSLDLASNGDGTATVAWAEFNGTAYSVQERQIAVGGVMGPAHLVSEPIERPENSVATHSVEVRGHGDGTASIAWSESRTSSGVSDLKVRRVGADGVIGGIHQIATGTQVESPRIAAHADGSVTAVWGEASSSQAEIYVTRITTSGSVGAPEHVCELGDHRSQAGRQCLDLAGGYGGTYDIAANTSGSATVVARRPQQTDVASWHIDALGQASSPTVLESADVDPVAKPLQVVSDGQGNVVAMWAGRMPSSSLPALHAARIGSDNSVAGNQTLFPLADNTTAPAQTLSRAALSTGNVGALPIWSAWTDWTANPVDDPTATRQVYAAKYPRTAPPTPACPPLKLIGLRGSGEPANERFYNDGSAGLGAVVGAFDKTLHDNGVIGAFATIPIVYQAVSADAYRLFLAYGTGETNYNESVTGGIDVLASTLVNDPCLHKSRYILAGYSQGAHVIGNAIESGRLNSVRRRIAATVLFGDPKFDSNMTGATFKSTFTNYPTAHGAISGRANRNLFVGYHLRSFCRFRDVVCQQDIPRLLAGELDEHRHYGATEAHWGPR